MPISTQLQAQIDAIQTRIDTLAPTATPEDIVMLAKAVEAVGGQATVFDVIDTGQQQKAELIATALSKSNEVVATGDAQVDRVAQQGNVKFNELSQEVQRYAAFGGAAPNTAGTLGMVPAPLTGEDRRFLRGDGAWRFPGEIPIGGIALIHPNMDTSRYLPAEGGTVLIADYPELAEVLGQAPTSLPYPSIGNTSVLTEAPGYSTSYRAAAVNGERAVIVRSASNGISYSANGGQNWANATVGALGFNGPFYPAISDSGRTVGWVNYDSGATPARVRFQACTAATFGAWTTHLNSVGAEQFNTTWNSIVVGLPQGVAAIDNRQADANQVLYQYVQDGATAVTREINLSVTLDTRITKARGALRVGTSLYLLVDNNSSWRALLRTNDAGEAWVVAWEGSGTWGNHNALNGSANTRQDAGQPSYVENGLGILHDGTQLLLIAADGTLSWVNQPSGHTLIAGSIHFVAGFYYAASANAVFRTADFISWEQLATASQILGATGTLARMWVHPATGSFGFYSSLNTLTLVQTRDFVKYLRNPRPSRWSTSIQLRRSHFTGDRFVWFIAESSNNSYYFDFAVFDLVTGRFYANNYFNNYGSAINGYWLLPLPGGRWLHFTRQQSSDYVRVASTADLYSYNLVTEFRLPTSTGEFGAVGAYGNQTGWLYDTSGSNRGGYRYYVRAQ